jgi:hypothetical protein
MTLTRWKLLAGVLGISIVGVVAMANPQCPNTKKDQAREAAPPVRTAAAEPKPATVVSLPVFETHATPLPTVSLPAVAPANVVAATPILPPTVGAIELPQIASSPPAPKLPAITASPAPLPSIDLSPAVVAAPKLELPATTSPAVLDRVVELPLPGVKVEKPTAPVVELKLDLPAVKPAEVAEPPLPRVVPTADPLVAKATEAPKKAEPAKVEEPAVRVLIHLGTGQPKFDVMAGDDVLLKAVCDNVDIRSPSANGAGVTPLKAGGKVRFSAPGCEGTCDNLTVLPSTGEVELAGNVKVHCRMGKGETEINAATMKFKLGSAPAYSVSEPTGGAVKAASARVP